MLTPTSPPFQGHCLPNQALFLCKPHPNTGSMAASNTRLILASLLLPWERNHE